MTQSHAVRVTPMRACRGMKPMYFLKREAGGVALPITRLYGIAFEGGMFVLENITELVADAKSIHCGSSDPQLFLYTLILTEKRRHTSSCLPHDVGYIHAQSYC